MATTQETFGYDHLEPFRVQVEELSKGKLKEFGQSGLLLEVYSDVLGCKIFMKADNRSMSKVSYKNRTLVHRFRTVNTKTTKRKRTEYRGSPLLDAKTLGKIVTAKPPLSEDELRLLIKVSPFGINPEFVRLPRVTEE